MSLYKDLEKTAAMFEPLNLSELVQRYNPSAAQPLGMLATIPLDTALTDVMSPITGLLPILSPLTGGAQMGIMGFLENLMMRKGRKKALVAYGNEMSRNPFSMTINELNRIRGR